MASCYHQVNYHRQMVTMHLRAKMLVGNVEGRRDKTMVERNA